MENHLRKLRDWYIQKNFDLLPKTYKQFLEERVYSDKLRKDLDRTFMFSGFKPEGVYESICKRLAVNGFMKKRKNNYFLTQRAFFIDLNLTSNRMLSTTS